MLGDLVKDSGEKRAEYARRSKPYDEETSEKPLQSLREAEGWQLYRENKNSLRMRHPKPFDEILENRFWNVLYRFGYADLNKGRSFKISVGKGPDRTKKQVDVFAKDDETVVIAECKACETPTKRSLLKDLNELAGLMKPIADAVRAHYNEKIFSWDDQVRLSACLERTLHFVFGEKRARKNREFFTIDPDLARAIIDLVAEAAVSVSDAEQAIDPGERREIETLRERREVRTFTSMNVPMGATLTFAKDPSITCAVVKPRKVFFRGAEMSPSAAALTIIREMGYDWPKVSGMDYWLYDGIRLSNLGNADPTQDLEDNVAD